VLLGFDGTSSVFITSSRWFKVAITTFVVISSHCFHVATVVIVTIATIKGFLFEPSTPYKLQNAAKYVVDVNAFSHLLQSPSNPKDFHDGLSIVRMEKSVTLGTPIALRLSDKSSALIDGFLGDAIPRLGGLNGTGRKHRSQNGR